ncbi:CubicO group peptidase, beta-lactamase class C family [Dyella jiangningensis]|uniref:serine hydrolase domain-containing protein n=1 Tax=Dyella sp. AtDHG13 TaxID=1938897 RepID=UPI00088E1BBE|nr:serine hydrolase domain-containing protein [Dyella sp. AtDHG13]PXV59570.1 CubicO group peptidase (beta-lactamase class C family) [Dyella sp. AtDHG13]SDJ31824.1 CubicO group peptidase, beta-lactamase class C family [Dyella jiangningensis]
MRKLTSLFASLLLTAGLVHAKDTTADVDALMARYQGDVPGASLLVIKDGKPLVERGYGYAHLETHEAATPQTNYRLASVSKQFTAAAILLLAERGKLSLDDHVRHWLPELPAAHEQITIRQLLSHGGGLIDYEDLMPADQTAQISDADVLRMLAAEPRSYFAPGSSYRYSNGGYVLLGLIVERASGQTLQDFMAKNIFQPLGMAHTLLYVHDQHEVAHRAYGYSEENGHWVRTDQSPTSATRGDGGIYSSIDDLAKWDAALYDHRLLSDASRQLAFSPQNKVSGETDVDSYGFGWRIHGDVRWHSGESMGFRNVIIRWPKQHLTVILLSNRNDPEPYPTALAIGQLFLPK